MAPPRGSKYTTRRSEAVPALLALGFTEIPGHGWFVDDRTAVALVEQFREMDRELHDLRRAAR